MKTCSKCRQQLPLEQFWRRPRTKDGRDWRCKACGKKQIDAWRKANPEKSKAAERRWREKHKLQHQKLVRNNGLKRSYGMTTADFDRMLISQSGRCDLCGLPFDERTRALGANVDHNHRTGTRRSLLHNTCNLLLGCADDNLEILKSAIKYLESWE